MVAAWGGYAFITNIIPMHVLVLVLMGRFNGRIYTSYCTWYVVGTLSSMQVPFVGFQPVRTSEHMGALGQRCQSSMFILGRTNFALGVFGLLQLVAFTDLVRSHVGSRQFQTLLRTGLVVVGVL